MTKILVINGRIVNLEAFNSVKFTKSCKSVSRNCSAIQSDPLDVAELFQGGNGLIIHMRAD